MAWIDKIAEMLASTEWGIIFTRDEIQIIAEYFIIGSYQDGDMIFAEGDRQCYMALIIQGAVDIVKDYSKHNTLITKLRQGTHFGELSLIDNLPRSASAVAVGNTSLLILRKERFDELIGHHPRIGNKILVNVAKVISERLRITTDQLVFGNR